jgi:hypothetical protein
MAYQSGKHHEQQAQVNDQAQEAYAATQAPTPVAPVAAAAPAPAPAPDTTAELQSLAQLHQSGALTDDEFAAAKAKLLGI